MIKVVYVTGCLGFIGSYVTRTCLEKGWYVKGVDKMTYASNKHLLKEFNKYKNFSFVHCDINDLKFLYDCDKGLLHCSLSSASAQLKFLSLFQICCLA